MPAVNIQDMRDFCNQFIRIYPRDAFDEMRMNTMFNMVIDAFEAGAASVISNVSITEVTSANFSNATDCPLISLDGRTLKIFWNDQNKYIKQGVDWNPLSGGGFTMLIPGFDSGAGDFDFVVTAL